MKKKILFTGIFVSTFCFFGIAQETRKVAVFEPAGEVESSIREIVREEISAVVVNCEGYSVLERQLINKVLEENKFQMGGLVDENQISEIGKRMGANYVFVSTVTPLGENYYISCKMIEVLTAQIKMQKTGQTTKGLSDIVSVVQNTVRSMLVQKEVAETTTRAVPDNVSNQETATEKGTPLVTPVKEKNIQPTFENQPSKPAMKRFQFGIKTGIGIQSNEDNRDFFLHDFFELGFIAYYHFSPKVYLNSGITFGSGRFDETDEVNKGFDYEKDKYIYEYVHYSGKINSFELPVYLGSSFRVAEKVSLYVQAGSYFGSLNGGSVYFGIGLAGGINFHQFRAEVNYHEHLNVDDYKYDAWNGGISFSLGYVF